MPFRPMLPLVTRGLACLVLSTVATESLADETSYRLRYKFEPNQFVHYLDERTSELYTRYAEDDETVREQSTIRKHYRVVAVDEEGNAVLEPVIDRVQISARFDEHAPIAWDSATDPAPPQKYEDVAKTLGKCVARTKVSPTGRLIEVLPTGVVPAAAADGGKDPVDADNDPSRNFLVVLPENAVRIGERWDDPFQVKVSVTGLKRLKRDVQLKRVYTLKAVDGDRAEIGMETVVVTPVSDGGIRAQLIQRTPRGTIVFDRKRGLIVSRTLTIDKQEVGILGAKSLMRAQSRQSEQLADPVKTARKPIGPQLPPDAIALP